MPDAICESITRSLQTLGVSFRTEYRGIEKAALGTDCPMDEWRVSFVRPDRTTNPPEFEYFTGLGLRAKPTKHEEMRARWEFPGLTENDITRRTSYGRRYLARLEEMRKPAAPHAADVLHSLVMDSSAIGQSFESWCGDCGYDSDSRKAFATYQACLTNAEKLRRVFHSDEIARFSETLQDY